VHYLRLMIFAALICVVEVTVTPWIALNGMRPNLALIMVMFVCLYVSVEEAVVFAWALGLAKDVCSVGPLGLNALLFSICAYQLAGVKDRVFRDHPFTQLLVAVVTVTIYNLLYLAVVYVRNPSVARNFPELSYRFLDALLYTSLLAPVIFYPLRFIRRWLGVVEPSPLARRR